MTVVSFIIRTEGRRLALLEKALESVFAQTLEGVEVVLVDDGGQSASDLAEAMNERGRITYLPIEKSGRSVAGNAGLECAQGKYLGFLDEDDELLPNHAAALAGVLDKNPGVGAVYASAHEAFVHGLDDGSLPLKEESRRTVGTHPFSRAVLWRANTMPIQAVVFRRQLFERLGGLDPDLDYLEDWDLWLRYSADSDFRGVDEVTSLYRMAAEKAVLKRRAAAHFPAFEQVRRKHQTATPDAKPGQIPALSVLVVNYNSGDCLGWCLEALKAQTFTDFEAIVVDNASSDDSFSRARERVDDARIRFMDAGGNLGFACGNNWAAYHARAPWIVTLNPDAFGEPDWLEKLMDAAKRHPGAAMFGSTQLSDANPDMLDGAGDAYFAPGFPWRGGHGHSARELPPEGETFGPCAAAAMYRKDVFDQLGGFAESFFCYIEDVDLAFRFRLDGHYAVQVPSAVVRHVGGISSSGSATGRYYGSRNMIWCFIRNMPFPLFWVLLPAHVLAFGFLLLRAVFRGNANIVGRGLVDALKGASDVWRQRRVIQQRRRAPSMDIFRALTWSPGLYIRRRPKIRRLAE